jgi:hypothetical protein
MHGCFEKRAIFFTFSVCLSKHRGLLAPISRLLAALFYFLKVFSLIVVLIRKEKQKKSTKKTLISDYCIFLGLKTGGTSRRAPPIGAFHPPSYHNA